MLWWLLACAEPMDLPEDPAATGLPVGVRTIEADGVRFEVWYPASDSVLDEPGEEAPLDEFVPDVFTAHVGDVSFPPFETIAVREAPVRRGGTFPVVLFSHGFGGFRLQSVDITSHLASRGYVVMAPDHPGRMLGDVLPCLFSPPLEGCNLAGMATDPGPDDLEVVIDWAEAVPKGDPLQGRLDVEHVGLSGHSAGGGSTGTLGNEDERFDALLTMAMGPVVTRDVPYVGIAGSCDAVVTEDDVREGVLASGADLVVLPGAGHLAFSDMCALDLQALAEETLAGREDLNDILYDSLIALGTDGCPPRVPDPELCEETEYMDLSASAEILRGATTRFFDAELKGEGPGLGDLVE